MKQTLTLSGLRGGCLFVAASASRFAGFAAVLLALLVLAPTSSTAQIGLIDTFISGPTEACLNQSITYQPGPDACNNVYWKVVYNDSQLALGVTKILCATVEKGYYYAYTVYDTGLIELGASLSTGKCGGLDYSGSTGSLPIKFKLKGKYKIETEPYGEKNGYPSACQNASKTVYVGMQAVGNISGPTQIACSDTRPVTYSIPPVPGALQYVWSVSNNANISFHSPSYTNGGATVTYQVNPTSGLISNPGTVSVVVYSKCAGEAAVTRSVNASRLGLNVTIAQGLPTAVCRGGRYRVEGAYGTNMRWTFNYYSNTGLILSQNYTGSIITVTVPNDTRIINTSYMLYANNICSGQAEQIGSGAGVSSFGCTPGARLAAKSEEVPPRAHPNPVSGVLTVHISQADGDGGFTAQLRDGLQRTALTGSTSNSTLRMDVRRLPAGVYLLQIVRPSGVMTTQKVLVIH